MASSTSGSSLRRLHPLRRARRHLDRCSCDAHLRQQECEVRALADHIRFAQDLHGPIIPAVLLIKAGGFLHDSEFSQERIELLLAKKAMVPDSKKQAVIFSHGNFSFL
jgi:hypothetical protein